MAAGALDAVRRALREFPAEARGEWVLVELRRAGVALRGRGPGIPEPRCSWAAATAESARAAVLCGHGPSRQRGVRGSSCGGRGWSWLPGVTTHCVPKARCGLAVFLVQFWLPQLSLC